MQPNYDPTRFLDVDEIRQKQKLNQNEIGGFIQNYWGMAFFKMNGIGFGKSDPLNPYIDLDNKEYREIIREASQYDFAVTTRTFRCLRDYLPKNFVLYWACCDYNRSDDDHKCRCSVCGADGKEKCECLLCRIRNLRPRIYKYTIAQYNLYLEFNRLTKFIVYQKEDFYTNLDDAVEFANTKNRGWIFINGKPHPREDVRRLGADYFMGRKMTDEELQKTFMFAVGGLSNTMPIIFIQGQTRLEMKLNEKFDYVVTELPPDDPRILEMIEMCKVKSDAQSINLPIREEINTKTNIKILDPNEMGYILKIAVCDKTNVCKEVGYYADVDWDADSSILPRAMSYDNTNPTALYRVVIPECAYHLLTEYDIAYIEQKYPGIIDYKLLEKSKNVIPNALTGILLSESLSNSRPSPFKNAQAGSKNNDYKSYSINSSNDIEYSY